MMRYRICFVRNTVEGGRPTMESAVICGAPRSEENVYRIVLRNIRPFTFTRESMKAKMTDDVQ